jgi:general L-amino acid transport system substrate-binding protein
VSEGVAGFSQQDANGRWQGLDADFCRAVAAAVLGNDERVEFVPLKSSTRFPALQARRIDLLARNTTWT